jgi:putative PIN family toxin of toxin-antitoxin system
MAAKAPPNPMNNRAVVDCMVYLQAAAREDGPAAACLQLVGDGRVRLYTSPEVIAEVSDVLTRPKVRQKFSALTPDAVALFLQEVADQAMMLAEVPKVFTLERDPKDETYVNLALAAGARYLVSWDNDLLDLGNEDQEAGKAFRQRFPDLIILNPMAFLREAREWTPEDIAGNP